jgi:hypothetical protein
VIVPAVAVATAMVIGWIEAASGAIGLGAAQIDLQDQQGLGYIFDRLALGLRWPFPFRHDLLRHARGSPL